MDRRLLYILINPGVPSVIRGRHPSRFRCRFNSGNRIQCIAFGCIYWTLSKSVSYQISTGFGKILVTSVNQTWSNAKKKYVRWISYERQLHYYYLMLGNKNIQQVVLLNDNLQLLYATVMLLGPLILIIIIIIQLNDGISYTLFI